MTKKRKHSYIDREEELTAKSGLPNILKDVVAVAIDTKRSVAEKKFQYKIISPSIDVADALVMSNGICVLCAKALTLDTTINSIVNSHSNSDSYSQSHSHSTSENHINDASQVSRHSQIDLAIPEGISTSNISGKRKKGAPQIKAGDVICKFILNGVELAIRAPIGGKLLELNDQIIENPELIISDSIGRGFIGIIFPDTEIPSVDGPSNWESIVKVIQAKNALKNLCFAWSKDRSCNRGDACKFVHENRQ